MLQNTLVKRESTFQQCPTLRVLLFGILPVNVEYFDLLLLFLLFIFLFFVVIRLRTGKNIVKVDLTNAYKVSASY